MKERCKLRVLFSKCRWWCCFHQHGAMFAFFIRIITTHWIGWRWLKRNAHRTVARKSSTVELYVNSGALRDGGLKFCLGGLSPPKPPRGDGTEFTSSKRTLATPLLGGKCYLVPSIENWFQPGTCMQIRVHPRPAQNLLGAQIIHPTNCAC